jgi:hypothetical protein
MAEIYKQVMEEICIIFDWVWGAEEAAWHIANEREGRY